MTDLTQKTNAISQDSHTEQEWQKKFYALGARCHYCQKGLAISEATKDHRTPKCRGGSNRIWNIVPACLPCNQQKGWRTEAEFLKIREAFSTKSQPRPAIDKPKPCTHSLDEINEPGLLKRLETERERGYWWRQA